MNDLVAVCTELSKSYPSATGEVEALHRIDASFRRGTITAVVGPSGSGKSSLLRIIAASDRPTSGSARLQGVEIRRASRTQLRRLRRGLGFVFQRPSDNTISYLTVIEHLRAVAGLKKAAEDELRSAARLLNLGDRLDHFPHQLSGGEQQRLGFAQAIIGKPAVVVADEPTAQLDAFAAADVIDALRQIPHTGSCVIVSTHDPNVSAAADVVLSLQRGRLQD